MSNSSPRLEVNGACVNLDISFFPPPATTRLPGFAYPVEKKASCPTAALARKHLLTFLGEDKPNAAVGLG